MRNTDRESTNSLASYQAKEGRQKDAQFNPELQGNGKLNQLFRVDIGLIWT